MSLSIDDYGEKNKRLKRKRTPELERRFRRLWADGLMIKVIAVELGLGQSTIKEWREELKLPSRQSIGRRIELKVFLKEGFVDAIDQRAQSRGQTRASYLRSLVMRDLGQSGA
jgi:uncharacterized protein YjcR